MMSPARRSNKSTRSKKSKKKIKNVLVGKKEEVIVAEDQKISALLAEGNQLFQSASMSVKQRDELIRKLQTELQQQQQAAATGGGGGGHGQAWEAPLTK